MLMVCAGPYGPCLLRGGATGEGVVYPGLWGQMEWDLNLLSFIS